MQPLKIQGGTGSTVAPVAVREQCAQGSVPAHTLTRRRYLKSGQREEEQCNASRLEPYWVQCWWAAASAARPTT